MTMLSPSVDAHILLEELSDLGVALTATPTGNLRYKPKSKVSEELKGRIKNYKPELLYILGNDDISQNLSSPIIPPSPTPGNPDRYGNLAGDDTGDDTAKSIVPEFVKADEERRRREAEELGLVARWSYEFGYISIHDPTTGEWYDVPTSDAPAWAKNECFKRRELRKKGTTRLLTREELEEVWTAEVLEGEFTSDAVTSRGVVYEDYIEGSDD